MNINLEEGKVKCYERKNIGTLGRVGRELSDNTKMPWPLRRVGHPESDRTSAVYQRNIWIVTKREPLDRSAELGTSCPIMQNAVAIAQGWTSGVRPDVCGMSEKYSSRNNLCVYFWLFVMTWIFLWYTTDVQWDSTWWPWHSTSETDLGNTVFPYLDMLWSDQPHFSSTKILPLQLVMYLATIIVQVLVYQ